MILNKFIPKVGKNSDEAFFNNDQTMPTANEDDHNYQAPGNDSNVNSDIIYVVNPLTRFAH